MLESINFVTPSIGFTSGPNGIFKSTDGGISWDNVSPPGTQSMLWGCFFVNQNVGLVVGGGCNGDGQSFFRTTDGGASWREHHENVPSSGMTDIMLYSQDGIGYGSSSGIIWKTTDGGRTWSFFSQTGPLYWQEEITNIKNSFLVPISGTDCSGGRDVRGELRFSTDAGKSWKSYQTFSSMFGSFLINETTGWGVGDGALVYYTSDAGVTWQNRNCGIEPNANLDDIYFVTDSIGWAVGQGIYRTNFVDPPKVKITASKPLTFCEGDSASLSASDGFTDYLWSNGSVGQVISAKESGSYRVLAYDKFTCKEAFDSVFVNLFRKTPPVIRLNRSKPIVCDGDTLTLSVDDIFTSYRWSTGDSTSSIKVAQSGIYSVIVTDSNGCIGETPGINVVAVPPIKPKISAIRNYTFCIGDSLLLTAPPGFTEYHWSNGITLPQFYTKTGGSFSVTVIDSNGCVGVSELTKVRALDAQNKLEILTPLPENIFDIPAAELKNRSCRDIVLHNRNDSLSYYITAPFLVQNILFSIPQSQLPIAIPPLGTISLSICYAPIDTIMRTDTLIFPDTCSDMSLVLRSNGSPIILGGNSECNIPVRSVAYTLGQDYWVSAPFPQPSTTNQVQVNFTSNGSHNSTESIPLAYFNDMLGTTIRTSDFEVTKRTNGERREMSGKFVFNTEGLNSGIYYIVIRIEDSVQVLPVIIEN
ncbi:MAG: hypothetical protein HYZ54_14780 [Ignavibacteriae bacterium]|nr:hypothetical protein [Ignavibacteriota bacterium]